MQTMIHQRLVRSEALVEASSVSVRCIHGDVHEYPLVPIEIRHGRRKYSVKAAVSSSLMHPLILGLDWTGFQRAVRGTMGMRTRQVGTCTLSSAYDQMIVIDGSRVRPDAELTSPHFIVVRDRLCRVSRDTQSEEVVTQLLVPRSRLEMVFQAAHYNPMAGHLGYDKHLTG
jgi:hypothetical protein